MGKGKKNKSHKDVALRVDMDVSLRSEETKEDENAVQQEIDSPLRIVVRNAFIDIDESDMSGSAEPGSPAHVSSPPASTASRADPLVGFAGEAEGQSEGHCPIA
eukprot:g1023.t1